MTSSKRGHTFCQFLDQALLESQKGWHGTERAWPGMARRGTTRQGMTEQPWHGTVCRPACLLCGQGMTCQPAASRVVPLSARQHAMTGGGGVAWWRSSKDGRAAVAEGEMAHDGILEWRGRETAGGGG